MWSRLRITIPREGRLVVVAALATLLVGWFKGINLLILLSFALVAVVLLNWWLARRQFRRLRADRRWTVPIFARSPAVWTVEATNDSSRAAAGFEIEDVGPEHRQSWFVDCLPGEQTVRVRARAVFPERGRQRLEPLRVVCLHPFGLVRRQMNFESTNECLVLPELGKLNIRRFRRWLTQLLRNEARLHRFARPSMIHQDDLHGLRPFRPGDNPRWIHWRTSARRNLKMVREFEEASGLNLIVVLDPTADTTVRRDPRLEAALSLAATICLDWCRHHEDFLMLAVAGSNSIVCRGHTSNDLAFEMLQALAVVEGERQVSPDDLLRKMIGEVIPTAPVLLVGARDNEPFRARLESVFKRAVTSVTAETAIDFYDRPDAAGNAASPLQLASALR